MSYYLRYVVTEDRGATLLELEKALQSVDSGYEIDGDLVVLHDEEIGQIEINEPGNPLFKSDLELLHRLAEWKRNRQRLKAALEQAKSLVIVQPVWSLGEEETLEALQPLFDWLLLHRQGVLVVEDGTFYDNAGLVE